MKISRMRRRSPSGPGRGGTDRASGAGGRARPASALRLGWSVSGLLPGRWRLLGCVGDDVAQDLQSVTEATDGDHVARVGGIDLDLGAQPADVDVDEAAVAEVVVLPDAVEQLLAAEHLAAVEGQLAEQPELGLGQVDLVAGLEHLALLGDQLEVAEHEPLVAHLTGRMRRSKARIRADSSFGANGLVR